MPVNEEARRFSYAVNIVYKTVNMWFVKFPSGVDKEALLDEGFDVLTKARETFKPDKGVLFKTYLITCLVNKMKSELNKEFCKQKYFHGFKNEKRNHVGFRNDRTNHYHVNESNTDDHVDLINMVTFLCKRLSKESSEILNKFLKAPSEILELNPLEINPTRELILRHIKVPNHKFQKFKAEVKQLIL
tara:strand:- start:6338 stop:6901 length:564 start_codon:yes stop_codon:yes gene_type:complete